MRQSLKKEIEMAMEVYDKEKIHEICTMKNGPPKQAIDCANYIEWTARTQEAIESKFSCMDVCKVFIQMFLTQLLFLKRKEKLN